MKIIGLCGRSGSGKSVISSVFSEFGIPSIDTDAVYREITSGYINGELSDCMKALALEFGSDIIMKDGSLNRRRLATLVFTDRNKLDALNHISHTFILSETDKLIKNLSVLGYKAVIVDAPLLFESGYYKKCDYIIMADAPEETLVSRIVARDGISEKDAVMRLKSQINSDDLRKKVNYVIYTDTDVKNIKERARNILKNIIEDWTY